MHFEKKSLTNEKLGLLSKNVILDTIADVSKFKHDFRHSFSSINSLFIQLTNIINTISFEHGSLSEKEQETRSFCKNRLSDLHIQLQCEDSLTQKLNHIEENNHKLWNYLHSLLPHAGYITENEMALWSIKQTTMLHLAQLEQIEQECETLNLAINHLLDSVKEYWNLLEDSNTIISHYRYTVSEFSITLNNFLSKQATLWYPQEALDSLIELHRQLLHSLKDISEESSQKGTWFIQSLAVHYTMESERRVFNRVFGAEHSQLDSAKTADEQGDTAPVELF